MKWVPKIPYSEFDFEYVRSRGPGGQNVNRTNSAVILRWNPSKSSVPNEEERQLLLTRLEHKLTNEGDLLIRSEESRDQEQNKKKCLEKLDELLKNAFFIQKKRKKTKPTKSSQRKRVDEKKHRGYIKSMRKSE